MLIISVEKVNGVHILEEQSGRVRPWFEGYIEVPSNLIEKVWESLGYCNLVIDDNRKLVDIELTEKPEPEPTPETPTTDVNFDELAAAIKEGVNAI